MATVTLSGPLFDRRADAAVRDYTDAVKHRVGAAGLALWHTNLDTAIRNPTPYYETQLVKQERGDAVIVHDRGIVYGPWLEGVGSRNRTTRFKGYFSLRRAVSELRQVAPGIAELELRKYLPRMG